MLTGEAVPVRKVTFSPAADGPNYDPDVHKACTLYGGTTVAQARRGARGKELLSLALVGQAASLLLQHGSSPTLAPLPPPPAAGAPRRQRARRAGRGVPHRLLDRQGPADEEQ